MVHCVLAGSAAAATVNITAALFCSQVYPSSSCECACAAFLLCEAVAEARVHVGSTTTIEMLVTSTLEHWSVSTTVPGAPAMRLLTTSDVQENAAPEGLLAAAIVEPIVWVARFAA